MNFSHGEGIGSVWYLYNKIFLFFEEDLLFFLKMYLKWLGFGIINLPIAEKFKFFQFDPRCPSKLAKQKNPSNFVTYKRWKNYFWKLTNFPLSRLWHWHRHKANANVNAYVNCHNYCSISAKFCHPKLLFHLLFFL